MTFTQMSFARATRWHRPLILVVALLAASGCMAIRGYPNETNPDTAMERENQKLNAQCLALPSPDDRRSCRDAVVHQRLRVIDRDFFEFSNKIRGEATQLNLMADLAVLGLSGAGATAPAIAPVLAAVSGGITGAKTAISKDAYYEKTMPALLAAMEAQRKAVLVKIEAGLALGTDKYSLAVALTDVEAYRQAGSIDGAVMQITQESGDNITKADENIANIRTGTFLKDKAGDALRKFWKPDGKTINAANDAALRDWMRKNDIDDASVTFFLRSDVFKDARLKAAKDLKLPEFGG